MNGRNSTALAVPKRKAARWDERWVAYPRRNPRRQGPRHRCTWFAGQARGAIKMAGHVYWGFPEGPACRVRLSEGPACQVRCAPIGSSIALRRARRACPSDFAFRGDTLVASAWIIHLTSAGVTSTPLRTGMTSMPLRMADGFTTRICCWIMAC